MNKENKVKVPQPGKKFIWPPTYSRMRIYSAPTACSEVVSTGTPACTCMPKQNVEKRPPLCDLQPNVDARCNLQRWEARNLNDSSEYKSSKTRNFRELCDRSTQTSVDLTETENDDRAGTTSTHNVNLIKNSLNFHRKSVSFAEMYSAAKSSLTSKETPVYTSTLEAGSLKKLESDQESATVSSSCTPFSDKQAGYDDQTENDEVFVSLEQSFGNISPIPRNTFTSEDTILTAAKPKKIARRSGFMERKLKMKLLDSQCVYGNIYNEEYLEDIIDHLLNSDLKYVITCSMLRAKSIEIHARATVINWLLKIHGSFALSSEIYLKTVRLFDNILCSTEVAANMYQLIAITSFWILTKHDDSQVYLSVKRVLSLTGEAYTADQLIDMEIKILNYIHYRCNITEPITFLEYYAFRTNVVNKDVLFASYYILELFALSPHFSTIPSSLLAANALYLSLECLGEDTAVWENMRSYRAYYHVKYIKDTGSLLKSMLERTVHHPSLPECNRKYNTEEMNFIVLALSKS